MHKDQKSVNKECFELKYNRPQSLTKEKISANNRHI